MQINKSISIIVFIFLIGFLPACSSSVSPTESKPLTTQTMMPAELQTITTAFDQPTITTSPIVIPTPKLESCIDMGNINDMAFFGAGPRNIFLDKTTGKIKPPIFDDKGWHWIDTSGTAVNIGLSVNDAGEDSFTINDSKINVTSGSILMFKFIMSSGSTYELLYMPSENKFVICTMDPKSTSCLSPWPYLHLTIKDGVVMNIENLKNDWCTNEIPKDYKVSFCKYYPQFCADLGSKCTSYTSPGGTTYSWGEGKCPNIKIDPKQ